MTIAFFLIFNIFSLHEANLIGTESKITYTSIGSGLIAIFGLLFIYQRLEKQQKQIDIQIDQRVDDRFNSAIGLLGSSETSARTGAIYTLYELAIEEDKYRSQIAQILCSHIRSKTNEKKYQKTHSKRPSSEIQTTIDLLFRKKGLYTKKFARAAEFPKANLSHAYLMGADFTDAQCQETDFLGAQCEGAFFAGAQCQGADFTIAQCRRVDFSNAQCHGAKFNGAQCQEADFLNSEFQGVNFILANFENTNFENTKCQGADFSDAKFYKETRLQSGGEINDEAIKAIKDAKPYLDNSWYEKMKKIIKENEGKDPEFKTYPFT
ncbi:pentapeptide repeat-containing protein [Bathymodiolus azoricus thioautotrophic gill symbiont]|uniref:pentapeptide repeat-containing protein n=1 Tax=Bathymodiolus azoricus thioautotrophic gill symbiont TaxID=235205 RepID=UPI00192C7BE7|nr:pentapeptide repeat-containing protein [Bathymodiolus azoricus thioautotrophic gill symbiont]